MTTPRPCPAFAALFWLWAASSSGGQPEVLDQVVAVVRLPGREMAEGPREALILLSDVRFEAALALLQRGADPRALAPLEGEALRSALSFAISQRLHLQDAERLRAFTLTPEEVDAAWTDLAGRLGGEEAIGTFLSRYGRTPAELRRALELSLRAARALDSKVRLRAQVSEAEIRRAWEADPAQRAHPFEARRGLLREMLFRQRYQALAIAETEGLRARAEVRILVSWGAPAP